MVSPPAWHGDALDSYAGAIAQLGERLVCNQKVAGSSPAGSMPQVALLIAGFLFSPPPGYSCRPMARGYETGTCASRAVRIAASASARGASSNSSMTCP
jgi:hypothetical protein